MNHQKINFDVLFDHVKYDGLYLFEDIHTSYWVTYGGGHKRRGTFIEYSKNFIDYLNAWHSRQRSLRVNDFTRSADSIHYYDSIIVIEKKKKGGPFHETTGNRTFQDIPIKKGLLRTIIERIGVMLLLMINHILSFFRLGGFIWK